MIQIHRHQQAVAVLVMTAPWMKSRKGAKTQKCSTSDPESGWFRKGEHKYLETSGDIRYTLANKEIYMLRKETIERLFGSAKEQHGFRYTQYIGNARMHMKAGLTFACMNLKKLAKILDARERQDKNLDSFLSFIKKYGSLYLSKKSGAGA